MRCSRFIHTPETKSPGICQGFRVTDPHNAQDRQDGEIFAQTLTDCKSYAASPTMMPSFIRISPAASSASLSISFSTL